ncbi:unnamed protein product [Clonostachys rosea f. rosea IK726]|uniref:Disease resistance R13L4/SHOC-2-like LRR domain-containing protein n=2 Tax=Bionectria ochroleuca TaxID=29856 RepID=A0A0B7JRH0_BIOOC|nr:unnamed protein product [Clonostachys rosea f. rosea IK726]
MAVERLDRSNGAPAAPVLRSLSENPLSGRRPIPNSAATSNGPQHPPIPTMRKSASSSNLAVGNGMNSSHVLSLAREAMRTALESENQVAEASAVSASLQPGVTIDLSRKNIHKLPEEVVDIMKNDLARLILAHNQLTALPARFSECTSLRYLNLRANQLSEFPMTLCDLKALEVLELGRNQIQYLPPEIAKLTSLKMLSLRKNRIRELPLSIGDMTSLQALKFEGNPLVFPPKDALLLQAPSPVGDGTIRDNDVELAVTAQMKRWLKQYSLTGRLENDQAGDESSEGTETPRAPLKRRVSGRFPIKVNGADPSDSRSPSTSRIPPVPQRSHYRGLSQQNTAIRRPGVMPLTLGTASERVRSNSETNLRSERSESRNRRMGVVSKKPTDLVTLDETQASNRFSHYRGLSHGSAMHGAMDPGTPTDPYPQRPVYVRRLSILPERRRESKVYDPVIEIAKGILYSVFQVHPIIQSLMSLADDGSKRSSLEIVFYNTNSHVEELEQAIQKHDQWLVDEDEHFTRENETVHRACQTLVSAYGHVCTLLADNIDIFVDYGDPRYIRTLLMLIYNSIMELRVTMSSVSAEDGKQRSSSTEPLNGGLTIRPHMREPSIPSKALKPAPLRGRNGTLVINPAANLRVATNVPLPSPYGNGTRTATIASATPRSGESFASINSRGLGSDASTEEDAQFDKIFLSLQRSSDIVLHTLPNFNVQLMGGLRNAMQKGTAPPLIRNWKGLIAMCNNTISQTEVMRTRLSLIKLKEPGIRSQSSFWSLCSSFVVSWTELAWEIKQAPAGVVLPHDTRVRLRPIHQSMKETIGTIVNSPWHHLLQSSSVNGGHHSHPGHTLSRGSEPMSPIQVPITPQSAALGPAMQATMPKTPQNTSFAAAFHGNVFDRADTLMANPGISMSRPTMPQRKGHSGLNSFSSVSSQSSAEGEYGIPSIMSPASGGAGPFRKNGGRGVF